MRGVLSAGVGVLCLLVLGCGKPPDEGILNAVQESVAAGVPAGAPAPEIQSLVVTRKKRMYWGEHVWTAEVQAATRVPARSGSDEAGEPEGSVVKEPFRVIITRTNQDGWEYEVQNDRTLPGGA